LGQYSPEVASTCYLYGRSLLAVAIQKNGVLGERAEQVNAVAAPEPESSSRFVFADDVENDSEEEGQDLKDLEVPQADDLELAWENLDLARIILSNQSDTKSAIALADVYLALGDVSLESGIY
jgi:HAT1-interacting factor 1